MLNIKTFSFNPFQEKTILLWDDSGEGVIVDPGNHDAVETEQLTGYITRQGIRPKAIWLTHGHPDHVFGAKGLHERYDIPVYVHPDEATTLAFSGDIAQKFGLRSLDVDFPRQDIREGDVLRFGQTAFEVIDTPGHTAGGVCFLDKADKVLLSGDTLFRGAIGRTDLIGGDYDKLIVSVMDKIMGLDGDIEVIPGHGEMTDIGYERTHNPFLQPFNEPEADWDPDNL